MSRNEDDLSLDQNEKLAQFQEVTGVDDVSASRNILVKHSWNVEAAIQDHLSLQDSSRRMSRNDFESNSSENRPVARTGIYSLLVLPQRAVIGIFRWCYFFISLPIKVIFSAIYRFIIPITRPIDPLNNVISFINDFERKYGPNHPTFFRGSYNQALTRAKTDLKFLVVYLHCESHQHTDDFCRSVLLDSGVIEYLNSNVLFWGCSVSTSEGYKVSQALRENGYPFLAVIVLKSNRMTVVARFEGQRTPDVLINRLQEAIQDNEAFLIVARADRQEREVNAALREEQDQAYLESLRVDQEKERKKREEKERERNVIEERERIRRLKVEWADKVPPEPDPKDNNVIHIVVKFPHGARLNRRFDCQDSLSSLYYYVFCHPDSPDRFQITTNFPRRVLPCEPMWSGEPVSTTFSDFGLPQRSMLFVVDLDA